MKKTLLILIALSTFNFQLSTVSAQSTDYYRSPLDIPILLSANFGEMRVSRFHTGIDIKTQGVVGQTLRAVADGYVARVTVAPAGYGRAIYINHPNGTMSVYGHMLDFRGDIEEYLRTERYAQKRSDINLFPEANRFPVKKGDIIGRAGNSGRSTGPHLHFEIRKSANSFSMNPLTHGWITTKDDVRPRIVKLYQIDVDTLAGVPIHSQPKVYNVTDNEDGTYSLLQYSPVEVGPTSYFVVEATDRKNDVANTFGIYRARMAVDGDEKVMFEKDGILFDHVRYCTPSVLYSVQAGSRNEVLMLALKSGNILPMYKKAVDRGVVHMAVGEQKRVEITVEDDAQNAVVLAFTIERDSTGVRAVMPENVSQTYGQIASDKTAFNHSADGVSVSIPAGALYEPMFYTQSIEDVDVTPRGDGIRPLSKIYKIGSEAVPLGRSMRVSISAADVPEELRGKARLATVGADGRLYNAGGSYSGGVVSGNAGSLGAMFCIVSGDTTAPVVRSSFASGANLANARQVIITASDNFSGVSYFTGSIDGEWIIFERNIGRGEYIHKFDLAHLTTGQNHNFVFTCRDGAGNSTTWRGIFYK